MKTMLIVALLTSVLSASAEEQQPQTAPPADAARGKEAFMKAGCYTCHGTVGQGGAGARLAPKPRAQDGFMAYVRSGRRGWSVAGGMPAYPRPMLSDAALADIYAYLESIPAPQPAAENPLLKD
jgi:ubiquinol-cytochrome c reductase cytochrome c subunit